MMQNHSRRNRMGCAARSHRAGDLPPVRYRKQANALTERYADLVRSAMSAAAE